MQVKVILRKTQQGNNLDTERIDKYQNKTTQLIVTMAR